MEPAAVSDFFLLHGHLEAVGRCVSLASDDEVGARKRLNLRKDRRRFAKVRVERDAFKAGHRKRVRRERSRFDQRSVLKDIAACLEYSIVYGFRQMDAVDAFWLLQEQPNLIAGRVDDPHRNGLRPVYGDDARNNDRVRKGMLQIDDKLIAGNFSGANFCDDSGDRDRFGPRDASALKREEIEILGKMKRLGVEAGVFLAERFDEIGLHGPHPCNRWISPEE